MSRIGSWWAALKAKHIALGLSKKDIIRVFYAGAFAFIGVFTTLALGIGKWQNFGDAKAAVFALIPTAIAAAWSAVKNGILADTSPLKG